MTIASGSLRVKGFWKPPPAFRFGVPDASLASTSLSSSGDTFLELVFRGAFFLGFGVPPFLSPPRVERPRARLFSWACSCAASRASASSTESDRLAFFLTGSGEADGSVSETPLVAERLFGEGSGTVEGGSTAASALMLSKRSSINLLMATCIETVSFYASLVQ